MKICYDLDDLKKQFMLDSPRLKLVVDNIEIPRNGDSLVSWDLIFSKIKNKNHASNVAYFVTQTSLADFYIREVNEDIKFKDNEFILDNGKQIIDINTNSNTLHLNKSFRKVFVYDDVVLEMGEYDFDLEYNFVKNSIIYFWKKEFEDIVIINNTMFK